MEVVWHSLVSKLHRTALMRAAADSSSPSPKSLRSWLSLSPSLCKGVSVSPSLFSLSSSPASSRQSSFRLSSTRSSRQNESHSKLPKATPVPPASRNPGSGSSRSAQLKLRNPNSKLSQSQVAARTADSAAGGYAFALAELAESLNILDNVNRDLDNLSRLLEHEELFDFLKSYKIVDEKKKSVIRTLADDAEFQTHTVTFLNVLIDKRRVPLLKDIIAEFEAIYDDLNETELATVTSAQKMENTELGQLAKKIQSVSGAKKLRIKNVVDDSLVAGFVIKYGKKGCRVIDMSVKGQVDRLAVQFEASPAAESSRAASF